MRHLPAHCAAGAHLRRCRARPPQPAAAGRERRPWAALLSVGAASAALLYGGSTSYGRQQAQARDPGNGMRALREGTVRRAGRDEGSSRLCCRCRRYNVFWTAAPRGTQQCSVAPAMPPAPSSGAPVLLQPFLPAPTTAVRAAAHRAVRCSPAPAAALKGRRAFASRTRVWQEERDGEGKLYWWHSVTRESSWSPPGAPRAGNWRAALSDSRLAPAFLPATPAPSGLHDAPDTPRLASNAELLVTFLDYLLTPAAKFECVPPSQRVAVSLLTTPHSSQLPIALGRVHGTRRDPPRGSL